MSYHNTDFIITQSIRDKGIIILNRPEVLNALNISMVNQIHATLKSWEKQKSLVIIKGTGEKAFCCGGELRSLYQTDGPKVGVELLKKQYILNGFIATYKIPYIAFMDGIVMGGGAGISIHGRYSVVTERTVFAMPETQIGLFPDCGASHFLPRLRGRLGWYLALTGHKLKGSDVVKAGLATHFCLSKNLNDLEKSLLNCSHEQDIAVKLNRFNTNENVEFSLTPVMEKINNCFSAGTVEEILLKLREDGSTWAENTIEEILTSCPISLKVTLKELQLGEKLSLQECLRMEALLASRFQEHNIKNLYEGIRTKIYSKGELPMWEPASLRDVSEKDVSIFFQEDSLPKIQNKL